MARPYIWKWTARIKRESLPLLQALAGGLGFIIDAPGGYQGEPSAPAMLDALAVAYRRDPGGTHLALKVLLEANGLLPERLAGDENEAAE